MSDESLLYLLYGHVEGEGKNPPSYIASFDSYAIPALKNVDGPSGLSGVSGTATAWPIATALACTWNPELLERVGKEIALEAKEKGVSIWLAPSVNIHRNPLCGRNFEYFSEDPLVSGKMAYILGVIGELAAKKPIDAKITLTYADGTQEIIEEKILLAAVCNGKCYGGGFNLAPDADLSDGILNVEIIRDVTRAKFISLVSDYKKGTHIDMETGELKEKFRELVYYKKCVAVKIEGVKSVCADGEIFEENTVDVKVIPHAINYVID